VSRVVLLSTGVVTRDSGTGGLTLEATAIGDDARWILSACPKGPLW
jgi:hypothetical protein